MKNYNKSGKAEKLKTTSELLIETLGYYDSETSKKLNKWLQEQSFTEGDDYLFFEIPSLSGSGKKIGTKVWRSHTWKMIREKIESIKELI